MERNNIETLSVTGNITVYERTNKEYVPRIAFVIKWRLKNSSWKNWKRINKPAYRTMVRNNARIHLCWRHCTRNCCVRKKYDKLRRPQTYYPFSVGLAALILIVFYGYSLVYCRLLMGFTGWFTLTNTVALNVIKGIPKLKESFFLDVLCCSNRHFRKFVSIGWQ